MIRTRVQYSENTWSSELTVWQNVNLRLHVNICTYVRNVFLRPLTQAFQAWLLKGPDREEWEVEECQT